MLGNYIRAAMGKAEYEILSDDGSFYGEIPGFEGGPGGLPARDGPVHPV